MKRRYWLTTHWAQEENDPSPHHQNLYLQKGHDEVGLNLHPDDKVLIYESAGGKVRVEALADGTLIEIPLREGRKGIVTAADVRSKFTSTDPKDAQKTYTDGSKKNWAWCAKTENPAAGYVPL